MLTTVTSTALLEGLKSPGNETVWRDYVQRYQPMIVGYAGAFGLRGPDAEDVAQQALLAFAKAFREGKYDRDRGRLRSWLFGIAHRTMLRFRRDAARREVAAGAASDATDPLANVADPHRSRELWDQHWRQAVLRNCLEEVRAEVKEQTFEAFRLFATEGWPARKVAEHLGISENAVFLAKRRILRRVRELRPQIEEIF